MTFNVKDIGAGLIFIAIGLLFGLGADRTSSSAPRSAWGPATSR